MQSSILNDNSIISLLDVKNETYKYILNENSSSNLSFNIVNSNVNIIFEFVNEIKDINYTINIDEFSNVKIFNIINDASSDFKINKTINNKGQYISLQIDLSLNSVNSIETVNLTNENANAKVVDGIYANKNVKKEYKTIFNHIIQITKSDAKIFAINSDDASVNIHTDAFIKNKAKGSIASQEGRIINLSDTCSSIVLPDLHIDENDVQASHSCSVGSVNLDHLYYLESRGLSELEARSILIKGYFNPIIANILDENIRNNINSLIDKRLEYVRCK